MNDIGKRFVKLYCVKNNKVNLSTLKFLVEDDIIPLKIMRNFCIVLDVERFRLLNDGMTIYKVAEEVLKKYPFYDLTREQTVNIYYRNIDIYYFAN